VKARFSRMNADRKKRFILAADCAFGVFLLETLDAAAVSTSFAAPVKERVAIRADFDAQHVALDRGAGWKQYCRGTMHGN